MKLWLDDERDPSENYIKRYFGFEGDETWVKTSQEAINLLASGKVKSISFDHDLGRGGGTGLQVAKWIEEQAFHGNIPRLSWEIHSMNLVGRKDIHLAMTSAESFWNKSLVVQYSVSKDK